jgi:hypothetical protein
VSVYPSSSKVLAVSKPPDPDYEALIRAGRFLNACHQEQTPPQTTLLQPQPERQAAEHDLLLHCQQLWYHAQYDEPQAPAWILGTNMPISALPTFSSFRVTIFLPFIQ